MNVLPTLLCVISIVFFVIGFVISIQFYKAEKKKLAALSFIITIIIILTFFLGGIYYYLNSIPSESSEEIIFVNEIYGEINGEFIVILPVPLNENKEPMFLESDYVVNGNITLNYIETEYGMGLEIKGKDNFDLIATTSNQEFAFFTLSVQNISINDSNYYGSHKFRIYLNATQSNTMSIKLSCYDKNENFGIKAGYIEKVTIDNGWQEVDGLYTKLVS